MRTKTIKIDERDLLFVIGGQLFDQAPNRQPRKAEKIMLEVRNYFRKYAHNDNEFYTVRIEEKRVKDFIRDLLLSIKEFEELNLTQNEYEKGVKVNDEARSKFSFVSAYDKEDGESWRNDFIDLEAFVQNVNYKLLRIREMDEDCFMCVNGDTKKCNSCSINPNFKINREWSREPKGKYTFACSYDCYKNKYICCEECKDNVECNYRCADVSSKCGLDINRIME